VLGEMSLLTGEPRTATVRALDGALVYEVGRRQLQPLLAGRPDLVDALQEAMAARLRRQESLLGRSEGWIGAFRRRFARSA
jgi:CRP-like cAMP-binding protein